MNDHEKAGSACYGCKQACWDTDGCKCACMLNGAIVQEPQVGCPLHEFSLHSATKYDDGTPIMSEPEKVYCKSDADLIHGKVDSACKSALNSAYGKIAEQSNQLDIKSSRPNQFGIDFCEPDCCPYWDKYCDHTLQDKHMCPYLPHDTDANVKYLEQAFTEFAKTQDELIEEYDATLKTHGETLESHLETLKDHNERITLNEGNIDALSYDLEVLQENVYTMYKVLESIFPDFLEKIQKIDKHTEQFEHKGSNFCGNCAHCHRGKQGDDTVYVCDLTKGLLDPDDSSCSMFEPPF